MPATQDPQTMWNNIVSSCKTAGKETLGIQNKQKTYQDETLFDLSQQQKLCRNNINTSKSKEERKCLQTKRSKLMTEIHKRIRQLEDEKIDNQLRIIENYKEDTSKCFRAMKELNTKKARKPLIIQNSDGEIAGTEDEQIKLITEHCQNTFSTNTNDAYPNINPTKMEVPFTSEEIAKAAQSLKNNRSEGEDGLHSEYLKHAPQNVYKEISTLFNIMAETGKYPTEIKQGILTPLQKPGKKPGPPSNLRPIILLSTLRKILAICLIRRCWEKLSTRIPLSQVPGRTKHDGTCLCHKDAG